MFHLHDLTDLHGAAFWFDPTKVISIVLMPWRPEAPGRLSVRMRGAQRLDTWVNEQTSITIAGLLSAGTGALIDHGIGTPLLLLEDPEQGQPYQAVNPARVQAGHEDKSARSGTNERLLLIYDDGDPQGFLVQSARCCLDRLRAAVRSLHPNLNGGL